MNGARTWHSLYCRSSSAICTCILILDHNEPGRNAVKITSGIGIVVARNRYLASATHKCGAQGSTEPHNIPMSSNSPLSRAYPPDAILPYGVSHCNQVAPLGVHGSPRAASSTNNTGSVLGISKAKDAAKSNHTKPSFSNLPSVTRASNVILAKVCDNCERSAKADNWKWPSVCARLSRMLSLDAAVTAPPWNRPYCR